jgi:hypothetical protein
MMSVCFVTLVFIAFVSLAVVPARQFAGKLSHLVTELRGVLIFAPFIELFSHCNPSL